MVDKSKLPAPVSAEPVAWLVECAARDGSHGPHRHLARKQDEAEHWARHWRWIGHDVSVTPLGPITPPVAAQAQPECCNNGCRCLAQCGDVYAHEGKPQPAQKPVSGAELSGNSGEFLDTVTQRTDDYDRDPRDIESDPAGILMYDPAEPLRAYHNDVPSGLTTKQAWWAGYRAGKGVPPDTPRKDSLSAQAQQPVSGADGLLANFDFTAHLQRQREWSERTFGPGSRAAGVIDHIRKELKEIEADPGDLREWVDVVILALDGAWRSGANPGQIIDAIIAKQTKNEGRSWPDWRTVDPNKAIEHDRSGEAIGAARKEQA